MQIKVEKLIYEGKGLGRNESGKPFFIKKSVPGDELEIEITKDKKSFSEGIIKKIITPSPLRVTPKCPHFDHCGGCDHQNISYNDQLKFKEEIFRETLSRANIETKILPIIPGSESEFYYRNVIRFFFTKDKDDKIGFAMHDYADFKKLIPIDSCFLQSETCNKILKAIKDLLNCHSELVSESIGIDSGSPATACPQCDSLCRRVRNDKNNASTHIFDNSLESLWQFRIREGKGTGEFMIELITKDNNLPYRDELVLLLKNNFPEIKSCYHTVANHSSLTDIRRKLLFGSPIIYEKIGKFTFQISPESFFQTNSLGIKRLYDKIKEFADIQIGDNILDLYCGAGTIGIYLSTLAKTITGIEIVQGAINDARANAKINKVSNCEFICADATRWLSDNIKEVKKYKNIKIILDPPRDGLSREIIRLLYELYNFINFQLIYVSCNPATFARDIKIFEANGFALKKAEPIDMFPQTHHIECIGLISKVE